MFNRGSNEVVVGKALLRRVRGFDLGSTVSFGATRWTVVGVFDAGGSVFRIEIWADLNVVQSLFNRNNVVQTGARAPHRAGRTERTQKLQRQRSAAEARRQIRSRLLRRTGLADLRSDSETRLAAGDRDGAGRGRRRAQHDVFVGRMPARRKSQRCAPSASAAFLRSSERSPNRCCSPSSAACWVPPPPT